MRSVDVVNKMMPEEGKKVGIEGLEARRYFSVYDDKPNMTVNPESKTWYTLISVPLGNGPNGTDGDSVGVVTSWKWPDPLAGVTGSDFVCVAQALRGGKWRKDPQAKSWAGKPVAKVLKLDLDSKADRAKIGSLLKHWVAAGNLVEYEEEDEQRRPRKFIRPADDDE